MKRCEHCNRLVGGQDACLCEQEYEKWLEYATEKTTVMTGHISATCNLCERPLAECGCDGE